MSTVEKPTAEAPAESLFSKRLHRLESIATELSRLYLELAEVKAAERQQKADTYLNLPPTISHGERQARASHEVVTFEVDVIKLNAEIQALQEERDMLRLLVEYVA